MPPQQKFPTSSHTFEEDSCSSESTVSFNSPATPKAPKRRLHFALTENQIHPIPHINDLSDLEVKETWYERADYERIKLSLIPIVRKMMKGERIEETNRVTIRGLEYRTREGAIRRQHNKAEAITAVMDEQDRQLDALGGRVDDEQLRNIYVQVNAHCQREAHELALGDVAPAQEHCADIYHKLGLVVMAVQPHENSSGNGSSSAGLHNKSAPQRKSSFSKLFKQMRIRRRSPVFEQPQQQHQPEGTVMTTTAA